MSPNKLACIAIALSFSIAGCGGSTQRGAEGADVQANEGAPQTPALRGRPALTEDALFQYEVPAGSVIDSPTMLVTALSAAEAAWLDRHGYPTADELASVGDLDVSALEHASRNRGDMKAAVLLGHRRALDGNLGGALAAFSVASNLGSLYARQQHALLAIHRQTGLPIDDLAAADQGLLGVLIAELQVARLLGDHRAQALIDQHGRKFYWDLFGSQMFTQVAILMDQYGEMAKARGTPISGPDPRPNAERWAELEAAPDSTVTLYTRARTWP